MTVNAIPAGDGADHPPRPRLALRVGVVGHRPDRLPRDPAALGAIEARLVEILGGIGNATKVFSGGEAGARYASGPPILRAISSLAEGADRLFARAALSVGFDLVCVMPFARAEFERDFQAPEALAAGALAEFGALLDEASSAGRLTIFELDGAGDRRAEAYKAAGEVGLNQSDLLVAVWDGGAANGVGGTFATLQRAIEFNVPVIWVDSRSPHGWRILRAAEDLACLTACETCPPISPPGGADALAAAIAALVATELRPGGPSSEQAACLAEFQAERRPRYNFAFAWKLFRDLFDGGGLTLGPVRTREFIGEIDRDWPIGERADASGTAPWVNRALRGHYAWSDKLADLYADAHRSAFIWSSLLAASAVFLALLPVAGQWSPRAWTSLATAGVEIGVLTAMVGLLLLTRNRRWHRRWTEYRVLAELIRELRVLTPFGGGQPPPRTPAHLASYGDPARSWMFAHARAIARDAGLPPASVDRPYVADQIGFLRRFIGEGGEAGGPASGQLGFHHRNCERMERIHRRLHLLAILLFASTIVAVAGDFLALFARPAVAATSRDWLILVSAFFPALGAALASINNQGEFARLQRRSRAMASGLAALRRELDTVAAGPDPTLSKVASIAARTAGMMIEETVDWRIVVLDLPHAAG